MTVSYEKENYLLILHYYINNRAKIVIMLNKNDITISLLGKANQPPLPITQIWVNNYPYLGNYSLR